MKSCFCGFSTFSLLAALKSKYINRKMTSLTDQLDKISYGENKKNKHHKVKLQDPLGTLGIRENSIFIHIYEGDGNEIANVKRF